ncbi:hypothetical protein HDU93_005890 [Gonapodya sp. JEL0774]|nr:hypothetical protein HDU93_005890 [Gonapodya sp. JEL0774]
MTANANSFWTLSLVSAITVWLVFESSRKIQKKTDMKRKISTLTTYPIKSCGGINLPRARLGPTGLPFDRHWVLVDVVASDPKKPDSPPSPRFVTAREFHSLVALSVHLEFEDGASESDAGMRDYSGSRGWLVVSGKGMRTDLRVKFPRESIHTEIPVSFTLWSDSVRGFDEGDSAAQWFKEYLSQTESGAAKIKSANVRLIVKDPSFVRPLDPEFPPPKIPTHTDNAVFADGFPILVLTTASVRRIAQLGGVDETSGSKANGDKGDSLVTHEARRYRPNILVDADEPFEEDKWREITLRSSSVSVTLYGVKLCSRCPIPSIDPTTGVASTVAYPLRTLMTYRRGLILGKPNKSVMGMNAVVGEGCGDVVEVGGDVEVVERGKVKGAA